MMGLGFLGNGGSSSSSNLSALAQPFTVDRSISKPNSNPLVNLSESHFSAPPFNHSLNNWPYSQNPSSRPDFLANPQPEIDSTHLTSSNPFRLSVSHSIHLPSTLSSLNRIHAPTSDPFAYAQCSDSIVTSTVQTKPYYPQYVPPAAHDNSPLVALNESGYDILPTSSVASLSGSYQDDYTQSLSGLEYPGRWGGFWNGLEDGLGCNHAELKQSFGDKGNDVTGSSVYNCTRLGLDTGATAAEGISRCEEAPSMVDRKCIETQGRASCIESFKTGQFCDEPLRGDPKFIPIEPRTSVLGSTLIFSQTFPEASSLESITNSSNHQKPYSTLHKKSSPAVVIRPPTSGTNFSAAKSLSPKNVNFVGNISLDDSEEFSGCNPCNQKEPHLVLSSIRKSVCPDKRLRSFDIDRNDPFFSKSCAMEEKEMLNNSLVTKDAMSQASKASSKLELPNIKGSDNIQLAVSAEAVDSAEKSCESLDYYNPAVDSPCWKGAPSSRVSAFEVSDDTPQLMKKLETCNDLTLQQPSVCALKTDDTAKISTQKFSESSKHREDECLRIGSPPSPRRPLVINASSMVHILDGAAKAGFDDQNLSSGSRVQFPDYIYETSKAYAQDHLKRDSDSRSQRMQARPGEGKSACGKKVASGSGSVDTGTSFHEVSEGCSVQIHATEYPSCLPCSGEDVRLKLANLHAERESTPRMNAHILVETIRNLSEFLLFHCSNEECALKEHDYDALKLVINNLDTCLLKNVGQIAPKKESLTKQGASSFVQTLPNVVKGVTMGRPLPMKELASGIEEQHVHEVTKLYTLSCEKDESRPLKDVGDIWKHDGMTKVLKTILHDNFHNEEEKNPQTLLYKNLWLEAEAALCSINYRARFDRMKSEMEDFKFQKAKDASENTVAENILSSSQVFNGTTMVKRSASDSDAKDNQDRDISSIQDSVISKTTDHVDDVETSVMARFQILKCRGESSNSSSRGQQQPRPVVGHAFTGKETFWSLNRDTLKDGCLDLGVEHDSHRHLTADHTEDKHGSCLHGSEHVNMKEFRLCVTDDLGIESCAINGLGKQLPAGWYDNSSEWEHILKEELQWQN